jgi:hypothetical protein
VVAPAQIDTPMKQFLRRLAGRPRPQGNADDGPDYARLEREHRLAVFDYPYSPRQRAWTGQAGFRALCTMLDHGRQRYVELLREIRGMQDFFETIEIDGAESTRPNWVNGWITALDSMALCALLKRHDPRIFMEVGSGNSTKFARATIQRYNLRTRIISLDPMPRAEVNPLCDEIVRTGLENVDIALFDRLQNGDMLFVDNSHRAFANSDVTVFFAEIMPALAGGVIWGVHDIFLPDDYPQAWNQEKRYYNEQYLMMLYLLGGAGRDETVFPAAYVSHHSTLLRDLDAIWSSPRLQRMEPHGCAYWMRRQI